MPRRVAPFCAERLARRVHSGRDIFAFADRCAAHPHCVIGRQRCPSLSVFVYHGDKMQRAELQRQLHGRRHTRPSDQDTPFDVILTTPDVVLKDTSVFAAWTYPCLVVDEAHRLKNTESRYRIGFLTFVRAPNLSIFFSPASTSCCGTSCAADSASYSLAHQCRTIC